MALTTIPASLSATALTLTTAAQPNITSLGALTTLTVDDITINGSTISDAGEFTLDIGADIILDSDNGVWRFKDAGTSMLEIARDGSSYLNFYSAVSDMDIQFKGNDGGSTISALILDMSNAGDATFNRAVTTGGNITVTGHGDFSSEVLVGTNNSHFSENNIRFKSSGHAYIDHNTTGQDIIFRTSSSSSMDTTAMVIQDNGNVGIGATSPGVSLHIASTSQARLALDTTAGNTRRFDIVGDSNGFTIRDQSAAANRMTISTAGTATFTGASSASLQVIAPTDNAFISLYGGYNDSAAEEAGITLHQNQTAKWQIANTTGNDFRIYNYAASTAVFTINSSSQSTFTGRIIPGELMVFASATGYIQFPGSGGRAWAFASSGGTAAPGTQSATFGFHHWSGSAWSNPINITASGKLGIGTDNPNSTLQITDENAGQPMLQVRNFATSATGSFGNAHSVEFRSATSTTTHGMLVTHYESAESRRALDIASNAGIFASFNTAGHFLMGKTASNFDTAGIEMRATGELIVTRANDVMHLNRISSDGQLISFRRGSSSTVGSINVATTGTSYYTTSDRRLKENILDAPSASDDIDSIQIRSFDWKSDGSHQKYGMIAQEVLPIAPVAVNKPEDSEEMMSIDYSKLVPMLIKEIQALRTRVTQLEEEK